MSISRLRITSRIETLWTSTSYIDLLERVRVDALGHRQVALRVHVDAQHAVTLLRERGCQVQRRRRLGHAALLVGERDDLGLSFHGGSDARLLESLPVGIRMVSVDSCMGAAIPGWPPSRLRPAPGAGRPARYLRSRHALRQQPRARPPGPAGRQAGDRHPRRGRGRQDDDLRGARAGARARAARRSRSSRSTRPAGWPPRWASTSCQASRTASTTRRCAPRASR